MFTLEQIKAAHAKVKSGADFPSYIHEIKQWGVLFYETHVTDGHTVYSGEGGYEIASPEKYSRLTIAGEADVEQFTKDLKEHQQGRTDYLTFCGISAKMGIEKWAVCMEEMTCTYYDKAGNKLLTEEIPH